MDFEATVADLLRVLGGGEGRVQFEGLLGKDDDKLLDLGLHQGATVTLERPLTVPIKLPQPLPQISVKVWPSDKLQRLREEVEENTGAVVQSLVCGGQVIDAWTCLVEDLGLEEEETIEAVLGKWRFSHISIESKSMGCSGRKRL